VVLSFLVVAIEDFIFSSYNLQYITTELIKFVTLNVCVFVFQFFTTSIPRKIFKTYLLAITY